MSFNPDLSKQAQEIYFSRKIHKNDFQNLTFDSLMLAGVPHKKISHLSYNHFHNILRLFNVLSIFPFTTSETKCENFYNLQNQMKAIACLKYIVNDCLWKHFLNSPQTPSNLTSFTIRCNSKAFHTNLT